METAVLEDTNKVLCPQRRGAMTPQETEPKLPAS